jgi:hypothetical protein
MWAGLCSILWFCCGEDAADLVKLWHQSCLPWWCSALFVWLLSWRDSVSGLILNWILFLCAYQLHAYIFIRWFCDRHADDLSYSTLVCFWLNPPFWHLLSVAFECAKMVVMWEWEHGIRSIRCHHRQDNDDLVEPWHHSILYCWVMALFLCLEVWFLSESDLIVNCSSLHVSCNPISSYYCFWFSEICRDFSGCSYLSSLVLVTLSYCIRCMSRCRVVCGCFAQEEFWGCSKFIASQLEVDFRASVLVSS